MLLLKWVSVNWRLVALAALVIALGVQTARISWLKSEHQAYKAEIERQIAENARKAALERARMAQNAQEALDALQTRFDRLNRSYRVLRDRRSAPAVPPLSAAAPSLSSCPGEPSQSDTAARRLEQLEEGLTRILEQGDREIAKLVELWQLQQRNSAPAP